MCLTFNTLAFRAVIKRRTVTTDNSSAPCISFRRRNHLLFLRRLNILFLLNFSKRVLDIGQQLLGSPGMIPLSEANVLYVECDRKRELLIKLFYTNLRVFISLCWPFPNPIEEKS